MKWITKSNGTLKGVAIQTIGVRYINQGNRLAFSNKI